MRYIRKQVVTTTINDDELKDPSIYIPLLENLKKVSVDISIEYRDEFTQCIKFCEKTRIIAVREDSMDFRVFMKNASSVVNNIKYDNIITIKLITAKNNIVIDSKTSSSEKHIFLDI